MEETVICLNTNFLILGLVLGSEESRRITEWTQASETLVTAMPAWHEFICGPVSQVQIEIMRTFLEAIIPFGEAEAVEASRLYNLSLRKRSLRTDAMIAGTAIVAGASLATNNTKDFKFFEPHGLRLI